MEACQRNVSGANAAEKTEKGCCRVVTWVRERKKPVAVAAILLLIIGMAGLNLYRIAHSPGVEVEAAEVSRGTVRAVINTSGRLIAADKEVLVAAVGGQVTEVRVKRGEEVRPGDVLLKIDDEVLALKLREAEAAFAAAEANAARIASAAGESELIQAEAAFRQAEASFANACEREKDIKELYKAGAVSAKEYEAAVLERELKEQQYTAAGRQLSAAKEALAFSRQGARAQLEQARVNMELARYQLEHATVCSRRGGQVLQLNVCPGDVVSAGQVLAVVGNREHLEVEAEVSESDAGFVQAGQRVEISSSTSQKRICQGYVREVAPQAISKIKGQSEQMVVPVVIELEASSLNKEESNGKEGFFPGANVDLSIISGEAEGVLQVPFEALMEKDGQKLVFVVENRRARERKVETGLEDTEKGLVQVLSGLAEGETVILNPPPELKEGTPVKLKRDSRKV